MNADGRGLIHGELTDRILKVYYEVYNEQGPGFLESVYQRCMVIALTECGLEARQQVPISVSFRGHMVGEFLADIVVNGFVLLELKAIRAIDAAHEAQVLNHLRAITLEVGLLLNFGAKPEFRRFAFENSRKGALGSR